MTSKESALESDTADREITVTRVINSRRPLVFEAFTEAAHLAQWWGPQGFTTTTRAFSFHEGGHWDFVMHGPDGTDYDNWITWRQIMPPERIVLLQGESADDADAFESTMTFRDLGDTTEVTLRAVFPTAALRQRAVDEYHAIEGGRETLDRLATYLTQPHTEVG